MLWLDTERNSNKTLGDEFSRISDTFSVFSIPHLGQRNLQEQMPLARLTEFRPGPGLKGHASK